MNIKALKQQIDELDGIDVFSQIIGKELKPGKKILSPLRGENHPSFNIWRSRTGKVLYKDFAAETGDIYAFVMKKYQCDFKAAVEHIAHTMNIVDITKDSTHLKPLQRFIEKIPKMISPKKAKITIVPREFKIQDDLFWDQYNINSYTLEKFRVEACKSVVLINSDGNKKATWAPYTYAFTYPSGNIKIYSPHNKQWKFFGNTDTNDIFGYSQFIDADNIENVIICAGQKDVMALDHLLCNELEVNSIACIALNSETADLKEEEYLAITERISGEIFVCYDNDDTGIKQMDKMVTKYPFIVPIYIDDFHKTIDCNVTRPHHLKENIVFPENFVFNDIADIASYHKFNNEFYESFGNWIVQIVNKNNEYLNNE